MIDQSKSYEVPRPPAGLRYPTAPSVMSINDHFSGVGDTPTREQYEHGIQVIDGDKDFNTNLNAYLQVTKTAQSGFNYHLISVFGSQSTGKSTLLNHLFGTQFGVMSETERRQTTKGIWMARNNRKHSGGSNPIKMAENILVMDVEGTDGRERGEDQDFERKSALFALATSEILIVNIWEHQVGLYQGANMGLLKTVFEVNLQLFLKDKHSNPRSLLFFVVRDHLGTTPLENLRKTLTADLANIWTTLSKPPGLEKSRIEDYFDLAFAALPHKILQPDLFVKEVEKLGMRFRVGQKSAKNKFPLNSEQEDGIFLPEYHRRIPADGFSVYAEGIWEQINNNKDLDLPTQQELLAQFRCDEISREALEIFDVTILPLEQKLAEESKSEKPSPLKDLGNCGRSARTNTLKSFESEAGRYHKGVFTRKLSELVSTVDARLKSLYKGHLSVVHKVGIAHFTDSVTAIIKAGQKTNASYEFSETVTRERNKALEQFEIEARNLTMKGLPWSNFEQQISLFSQELELVSANLRKEEMRRLGTRTERWVRTRLSELVGLEFNKLGSARRSNTPDNSETLKSEISLWDRIWEIFTVTISEAEARFIERALSFGSEQDEIEVRLGRLRRQSWVILRSKIDEEVMEGNIMTKLRENFEDKFRYDEAGVPRIWRPSDDIEGLYTKAKSSTLSLIPLLSKFTLAETCAPPPLPTWIGISTSNLETKDQDDLIPIGGVDEEEGKSLEDETTILSEGRSQDLMARFKKQADGVYIEAKRSALGGVTQVPLYFWLIVLFLGWNEFLAIIRNPIYFILLLITGSGAYITWNLNLWGPIISVVNAASAQGIELGKERLREYIENNEHVRNSLMAKNTAYDSSTNNTPPTKEKELK
ncbi:BgTH12-01109 [Blumeria graminis f. sp. triticale]|uniref:BgTH12-01109 n=1 Tax=Blumeria graminis f. sp. triticale TaxID=1689686 RepID=A0A9W4DPJ5_BLUGR|nr:BgTH12-01109 [Blumeria graminis f. sp. triticale]